MIQNGDLIVTNQLKKPVKALKWIFSDGIQITAKNRPINPRDTMQPDRESLRSLCHKVAANLLMAILILYGAFGITGSKEAMPDFGLELKVLMLVAGCKC